MRTLHDEKMMILTRTATTKTSERVYRCVLLRESSAVILSLSIKKPTYNENGLIFFFYKNIFLYTCEILALNLFWKKDAAKLKTFTFSSLVVGVAHFLCHRNLFKICLFSTFLLHHFVYYTRVYTSVLYIHIYKNARTNILCRRRARCVLIVINHFLPVLDVVATTRRRRSGRRTVWDFLFILVKIMYIFIHWNIILFWL